MRDPEKEMEAARETAQAMRDQAEMDYCESCAWGGEFGCRRGMEPEWDIYEGRPECGEYADPEELLYKAIDRKESKQFDLGKAIAKGEVE